MVDKKKSPFGQRGGTSGKKKSNSAELFAKLDWEKMPELLVMTDDEAKSQIESLTITGTGKSPEQVDQEVGENFERAMKNVKFASIVDTSKELNSVLPRDKIALSSTNDEITEDDYKKMLQASLVFAFLHGNVTEKKHWFQYKTVGDAKFFASLPDLDVNSRRSNLVHMYREQISKLLEKNDNTLLTVLKRSEFVVHESKRKFCFPKGHLLVEPSEIQQVRTELSRIFEQMGNKNLAERKFDLPWFANEGKWEDVKKKIEKK